MCCIAYRASDQLYDMNYNPAGVTQGCWCYTTLLVLHKDAAHTNSCTPVWTKKITTLLVLHKDAAHTNSCTPVWTKKNYNPAGVTQGCGTHAFMHTSLNKKNYNPAGVTQGCGTHIHAHQSERKFDFWPFWLKLQVSSRCCVILLISRQLPSLDIPF